MSNVKPEQQYQSWPLLAEEATGATTAGSQEAACPSQSPSDLQWMMQARGVSFVDHYIDDFVTLGSPSSEECARNVQTMLQVCREARVPIELEGPASALSSCELR